MKVGSSHKRSEVAFRLATFAAKILPMPVKGAVYRVPWVAGLVRNTLNRYAPEGQSVIEIAGGRLAGFRVCLDLHQEKDLWLGTYEPELQRAIANHIQPGMTVYDVGANIGYITLLLSTAVGNEGAVYAFEPLPENLKRLETNLALNGYQARVHVVPVAVSNDRGTARFWVHRSASMGKVAGSVGRPTDSETSIEVEQLDLDTFVFVQGHPPPNAIKIDVEGGEVLVLPGMRRILREVCPLLFLELHGEIAAKVAWEELQAAGYTLYRMVRRYSAVDSFRDLPWKAYIYAQPPQ